MATVVMETSSRNMPLGENIESSSDEDDQDSEKCDFVNVSVVINSFFLGY